MTAPAPTPKMGMARFVVVADTDREALAIARRAYLMWHKSFNHLFRLARHVAGARRTSADI